jgi:hypothetical protein
VYVCTRKWLSRKNSLTTDFSQTVEICTPSGDDIFQQDGATSRTNKVTQEPLDEEVPRFNKNDEWPDCNPMDYHVHVGLALREGLSELH